MNEAISEGQACETRAPDTSDDPATTSRWTRLGTALAVVGLTLSCSTGGTTAEAPPDGPPPTYQEPAVACVGEAGAIPDDPTADLCARRRHGRIAFVAVDGLEPSAAPTGLPTASTVTPEVARTMTDGLRNLTHGAIDLQPTTLTAPLAVAETVRATNAGFMNGQQCVALEPAQSALATTAERLMPELSDYDFVIALGGVGCRSSAEGSNVGGVALYKAENSRRSADVYMNSAVGGFIQLGDQTPAQRLAGVAAHEQLHNFGLGHAGSTYCTDKPLRDNPAEPVDIRRYFAPDCRFSEYGDIGNVMSNVTDISPAADLSTALSAEQRAFLDADHTHHYTALTLSDHDHVRLAPQGVAEPNALSIYGPQVPDDVAERYGYTFTQVSMEPLLSNDGTTRLALSLATPRTYEHYTTNLLDSLVIPAQGRQITLGSDAYFVRPLGNGAVDVQVDRATN